MERLIVLLAVPYVSAGQCSFPDELLGNWTSSNYGTLTFSDSSPQFIMSYGVQEGTSSSSFNCSMVDGTQYILKSLDTVGVFHQTRSVYAYLCFDLRKAGPYSYYYYQNSEKEAGFDLERIVGISEIASDVKAYNVCTASLDTSDFHTMVKVGFEHEAAIQCADPLLLSATYTYADSTGTYCTGLNTTSVDSCSNKLTTIQFNKTMINSSDECANKNPGFSTTGVLGCVANVYDTNRTQYYVSLYNYDDSIANPTNYRYTCLAVSTDENDTVYLSLSPDDCETGQTATVLPTNGALMELTPYRIPSNESAQDWSWLIILCIALFLFLLIVGIIIALIICIHMKKKRRKNSWKRNMLTSDKHPLGEISLRLDAPSSLEKITEATLIETRKEFFKSLRGRTEENPVANTMSEPSLILDLNSKHWSGKPMSPISENPYNELSNGEIVPVKPKGNKAAMLLRNYKQRSLTSANLKFKPSKSIPNGTLPSRKSVLSATFVKNEPVVQSHVSEKPIIEMAPNVKAENIVIDARKEEEKCSSSKSNKEVTEVIHSVTAKNTVLDATKEKKQVASGKINKKVRTSNTPSIRSWTGKHLTRSRSDIGAKFGRGLTSTRLGSVTKRQTSGRKGTIDRSISLQEPIVLAADTLKEPEKDSTETQGFNEFVFGETGEDVPNTESGRKSILKKTPATLPSDEHKSTDSQVLLDVPDIPDSTRETSDATNYILKRYLDLGSPLSVQDSYMQFRSRTDLTKKAGRPTPSRAPWR